MAYAVHVALGQKLQHRFDIYSGRREQHLAQRSVAQTLARRVQVEPAVGDDLAHEAESVGMYAARRYADQSIAHGHLRGVDELRALYNAAREARDVVLSAAVHARHLGSLAADKRAARLPAALRHAGDDSFDLGRIVMADGHVVEEEQRLGALRQHVVDAHGHGIDADRVVLVHLEGEFEFGAHAVGAAYQNRLLNGEFRQVEHASESAYVAHSAEACGRCHMRLDASDDLVSGFEIDTGFFVTFCHIVFFVNSYHCSCSDRHCGTDRLRSGRRSRPCRARCGVRPRAEPPARGTPTNRPR